MNDADHPYASRIMERIRSGEHGKLCVSDYVLDKVVTYISQRLKLHDLAVETLISFLTSKEVALLKVDFATVQRAVNVFRRHDFLSFTDATTCVLLEARKIS